MKKQFRPMGITPLTLYAVQQKFISKQHRELRIYVHTKYTLASYGRSAHGPGSQ